MQTPVETPPTPVQPPSPGKVRTGRYGELEEHEVVRLLESFDDERARARFREAFYISVIFYLVFAWFLAYGPRVLFHQPRVVNPMDVLKQREKELTYLNMPKDLSKKLPHKPTNVISDKDRTQQTKRPTLDKKTLEQLQAMEKAGAPGASRPAPTPPAPAPQQAEPQQQAPQQAAKQPAAPLPAHPVPQQQAMVDAPKPTTRPNFGNPNQTAGDAIRRATQELAQNRGNGGDFGANIPVEHQGLNTGVDILSDTMGVDFSPYLKRILREIYNTWLPLIPEEARPPLNKQGETLIRFTILPDGRIGAMHLDGSTHDQAIDRAAWGSIVGVGQFPPLPKDFHGPNLELRIHYLVNKRPE